MNALDLFCGACGGWSLGLHRAGFTTVAAVEIDPWRRAQFARNFPHVRLYDDVRAVTAERLRADGVGPIGLVCGSPPCQDASTANTRGKGIDGERTGLYLEAVRIVREVRPGWCSFENVPGIRNRGIDRVLGELERAGYAAWPLVVGALDFGAPHIRKRSWVVCADAATVQRLALPWGEPDGNSERAATNRAGDGWGPGRAGRLGASAERQQTELGTWKSASDADARTVRQQPGWRGGPHGARAAEPEGFAFADSDGERRRCGDGRERVAGLVEAIEGRLGPISQDWNGGIAGRLGMDDGLPKGMARPMLAAYGDAVLPQITELIGRAIMRANSLPTLLAHAAHLTGTDPPSSSLMGSIGPGDFPQSEAAP